MANYIIGYTPTELFIILEDPYTQKKYYVRFDDMVTFSKQLNCYSITTTTILNQILESSFHQKNNLHNNFYVDGATDSIIVNLTTRYSLTKDYVMWFSFVMKKISIVTSTVCAIAYTNTTQTVDEIINEFVMISNELSQYDILSNYKKSLYQKSTDDIEKDRVKRRLYYKNRYKNTRKNSISFIMNEYKSLRTH